LARTLYNTVGTETTLSEFWHLARELNLIYAYNLACIQRTLETAQIKFEPETKILDIASGKRQYIVNHLWQSASLRVGLDFYLDWLKANQDVDVRVCGDMYLLPFQNQAFDTIVSVDTIEHAEHPVQLLSEMNRVLRRSGKAVIFTPNLLGYKNIVAKFGRDIFLQAHKLIYGQKLHYDVFYRANTIHSIQKLCASTGFRIQKIYYIGEISHFLYRSRLLSTLAFLYDSIMIRYNAPWLLGYMMIVLEKP